MCIIKLPLFFLLVNSVVGFGKQDSNLNITFISEHIQTSYPENSPLKVDTRILKFNRTAEICELNITITDTIDHRYYIDFEIQLWGDSGWRRNVLNYNNYDPCKQLNMIFGPKFAELMEDIGLEKHCPFKPGFYHYKNSIELGNNPWAIYHGRNRIVVKVFKHRKELILTFAYISRGNELANVK